MNISRAYLMPWHNGLDATRAYSMLSGIGDVNSSAQAALTAAGYTNVQCAPQTESTPGGATFTENLCTTGQGITMTADNVAGMSQAQLKAQLASENSWSTATQNNTNQQDINEQLAALTGNANAIAYAAMPAGTPTYNAPGAVAAPNATPVSSAASQQQASQVPSSATAAQQPIFNISIPGSAASGSTSGLNLGGSTIIPGIPDLVVYAGGALALVLVLSMGGRR